MRLTTILRSQSQAEKNPDPDPDPKRRTSGKENYFIK